MRVLRSIGRVWGRVELFIGGLFLTVSVLLVVGEILSRRLLSYSMVGSAEIAAYSLIWSVFFTASMAVKKNIHVRIDVIFMLLPTRVGRYIDAVGTGLSALFTGYLTWSGIELVRESWMLGQLTMTMLRLPIWVPHLIVPIGGFLLTVRFLERLVLVLSSRHETFDPAGQVGLPAEDPLRGEQWPQ